MGDSGQLMGRKQPVSSSAGINVQAPEGFLISGDTKVVPEQKKFKPSTDEEKFISSLVHYIQFLKEQLVFVQSILESAQKRNDCKDCGKK